MNLDFNTLMDWLKEKYPYSMRRWIHENYWITSDSLAETKKGETDE